MRFLCAVVFLFCTMSAYTLNVIHLWSVGDVSVEYIPENTDVLSLENYFVAIDMLKFYWVETNSGLGFNITALGYRQRNSEVSLPFPPLELIWNPLSIKTPVGYLNWGVYDRAAWFGRTFNQGRILNSIGTRLVFSSHPFGRTRAPHHGIYHVNRTLFFEYMMDGFFNFGGSRNTFRAGLSVDIGLLFFSAASGVVILAAWPFDNKEERTTRSDFRRIAIR
jgi:hypothetical protein